MALLRSDRGDWPACRTSSLQFAEQLHPVARDHTNGDLDGAFRPGRPADDRGLQDRHGRRDVQQLCFIPLGQADPDGLCPGDRTVASLFEAVEVSARTGRRLRNLRSVLYCFRAEPCVDQLKRRLAGRGCDTSATQGLGAGLDAEVLRHLLWGWHEGSDWTTVDLPRLVRTGCRREDVAASRVTGDCGAASYAPAAWRLQHDESRPLDAPDQAFGLQCLIRGAHGLVRHTGRLCGGLELRQRRSWRVRAVFNLTAYLVGELSPFRRPWLSHRSASLPVVVGLGDQPRTDLGLTSIRGLV